ncbi:MAG: cardiolipin synthase [Muribaculaceae bacterium]|nr:cardiolipin synthase [Muribaculaceae bacterium]
MGNLVTFVAMLLTTIYNSVLILGFTLAYFAIIISCIVVVLSENRNPIRSMAWTIALLFLPVVGLIFYLFFGRSLKGQHIISRHNKRKLLHNVRLAKVNLDDTPLSDSDRQLVKLSYTLTKYPLTKNNRLEIYTHGTDKFEALIHDLECARDSIYIQYYIFSDDVLGTRIADILIDKAREGVSVCVIYDHVGSLGTSRRFFNRMRDNGVDVHPFFKVTFPQLANRINWRNHRKIAIIDNRVGYIGGMNIADRYYDKSGQRAWRDTHFRVEGDIIGSMLRSFVVDWYFLTPDGEKLDMSLPENPIRNDCGIQLVTDGPVNNWDNLSLCFLKAISSARKLIYIQTPYFLPTDSLLHALEAAALSKVDVRIMIPRRSDSRLLQFASFSYVTQCLRSNIKVYLYEPGMLHAKTMIIDDNFVTAGSTNFDFRSFENNFECNLQIYDSEVNHRMRDIFFRDLEDCTKLTYSQWKKRPMPQRAVESVVRLVAPIL